MEQLEFWNLGSKPKEPNKQDILKYIDEIIKEADRFDNLYWKTIDREKNGESFMVFHLSNLKNILDKKLSD